MRLLWLYKRHLKLLTRLQRAGRLGDIRGLTWYSWKDTGISTHALKVSPLSARDQAGHADMKYTMLYYHSDPVNGAYKALPNDLSDITE